MTKLPFKAAGVALCILTGVGCPSSESSPDAGPAFPNRRVAFAAQGRTLGYLPNQYSDTISVLDLADLSVLGEVPVGINPVEIDGPRALTFDRGRGVAYLVLIYPMSVVGAHAVAHGAKPPFGYVRELSIRDLAPLADASVDRRAASLALAPDAGMLAVVHFDQDLSLLPSDIETRRANLILIDSPSDLPAGTATKRKQPVCVAPLGVVYGRDRSRVFMACTGEDQLAVVDTSNLNVVARVPAGDGPVNKPTDIVIDPAGTEVILSNELTSQVVAFKADDTATQILSSQVLNGLPGPVTFLSKTEWLVPLHTPSGAARVDAATGEIVSYRSYGDDECVTPHAATVAADGRVFLVCEGDHYTPGRLVRVDPVTLEVQAGVAVGLFPEKLVILEPEASSP